MAEIVGFGLIGGSLFLMGISIYIIQYLNFKSLSNLKKVKRGDSVERLKEINLTPKIFYIDNNKFIYAYYYVSLLGILFPVSRFKCITFTIENDIIVYADQEI